MDKIIVKSGFLVNDKQIKDHQVLRNLRAKKKVKIKRTYCFSNRNYRTIYEQSLNQRISLLENLIKNYEKFIDNLKKQILDKINQISETLIKNLEVSIKTFQNLLNLTFFQDIHLVEIEDIMNNSLTENYLHDFEVLNNLKKLYNQTFYDKTKNQRLINHQFSLINISKPKIFVMTKDEKSLFLGCNNGLIRKWKLPSFKEEIIYYGHENKIRCISVDYQSQRFISADSDDNIKLWKFKKDLCVKQTRVSFFSCMELDIENRILIVITNNFDINIFCYPTMTKTQNFTLCFQIDSLHQLADKSFFAYSTGDAGSLSSFKIIEKNEIIYEKFKEMHNLTRVTISEKNDFFLTLQDYDPKSISKHEMSTFETLEVFPLNIKHRIKSLVLHENEKAVLLIQSFKVFSYNLESKTLQQTEKILFNNILFPKKYKFLIGLTKTRDVHLFEPSSLNFIKKMTDHDIYRSIYDKSDAFRLCQRTDKTLYIWNYSNQQNKTLEVDPYIEQIYYSGNGKYVGLLVSRYIIKVLQMDTFEVHFEISVQNDAKSFILNHEATCIAVFSDKSLSIDIYVFNSVNSRLDSYALNTAQKFHSFKIEHNVINMIFSDNQIYLFALVESGAFLMFNLVTQEQILETNERLVKGKIKVMSLIENDSVVKVEFDQYRIEFLELNSFL